MLEEIKITAEIENQIIRITVIQGGSTSGGDGDMLKSIYDPNNKNADVFDMGNMEETTTAKIFTNTERLKLASITEIFTTALKTAYDNTVNWISTNGNNLINHLSLTNNPHNVTASQVGAPSGSGTSSGSNTGDQDISGISTNATSIGNHVGDTNNPHSVTKAQVGLGSVQNVDTTTTANINDTASKRFVSDADKSEIRKDVISLFLSPEGSNLTTGDTDTIEAPYNFTLNGAFIAVTEAPTGGNIIVDFKKNGVSITSTKASISSTQFNSLTGVAPVFTTTNFVKGDRITHNIFQVGSLTTGKSLKSYLSVTKN